MKMKFWVKGGSTEPPNSTLNQPYCAAEADYAYVLGMRFVQTYLRVSRIVHEASFCFDDVCFL